MKFTIPKKISARTVTALVLVVVVLFELYLAYFSLFIKLMPQPQVTAGNTTAIVRINRTTLNDVTQFLDGLQNFVPASIILTNPNPFKYSP